MRDRNDVPLCSGRDRTGTFVSTLAEPIVLSGWDAPDRAIANGWLRLHESGTYVKFTEAGATLFAQRRELRT